MSVGRKACSLWCLGCRRSQAQLILNTEFSHILDVCVSVILPNTSSLEFLWVPEKVWLTWRSFANHCESEVPLRPPDQKILFTVVLRHRLPCLPPPECTRPGASVSHVTHAPGYKTLLSKGPIRGAGWECGRVQKFIDTGQIPHFSGP